MTLRLRIPLLALLAAIQGCALPEPGCGGAFAGENLLRACGTAVPPPPSFVAEAGNVWPATENRVPSLLDLRRQMMGSAGPQETRRRTRDYGLCRRTANKPPPGAALGLC